MADERRYREDEIREIFDLAIAGESHGGPAVGDERGLTLAQLQEVGLEVGVEPERIAEAALTVDTRRTVPAPRTSLGVPYSVDRVLELPRAVTDLEWTGFVSEFRNTFGAGGQVSSSGGVREWSNGDLRARLEPTETAHRLHLEAQRRGVVALNRVGVSGLAMGLILLLADAILEVLGSSLFTGDFLTGAGLVIPVMLAGLGIATLGANLLSLPGWAHLRERQMEYVADRVRTLLEGSPVGDGHESQP